MLRRPFTIWLFTLTLLIGQLGAFAHATGHALTSDSGLPSHVCELCLAQANLGSAAPSTAITLPIAIATYHWARPVPSRIHTVIPPLARARAPPAPL